MAVGIQELEQDEIAHYEQEMDEELVDDSDFDDDQDERMRNELAGLMDYVFGPGSDEEEI